MDHAKIDRDQFVFMGLQAFFVFAIISLVHAFTGSVTNAIAWVAVGGVLLFIAMIPAGIFHMKYKKAAKVYGDALDKFFKIYT